MAISELLIPEPEFGIRWFLFFHALRISKILRVITSIAHISKIRISAYLTRLYSFQKQSMHSSLKTMMPLG